MGDPRCSKAMEVVDEWRKERCASHNASDAKLSLLESLISAAIRKEVEMEKERCAKVAHGYGGNVGKFIAEDIRTLAEKEG